jgi:predicted dienelactone hydrolase
MDQKHSPAYGTARCNPTGKFRPIGMSRIFVNTADAGSNLDLFALDTHGFRAIFKEPPECTLGLETDQQHRTATVP